MLTRRSVVALVAAVVPLLGAAAPARADLTKAMASFEKGTRLYQVGEYTKALEEFKAGYVEEPDPSFLYNVAQCYRQLGQTRDALMTYRRFLSLAPETPLRPEVERKIRELEEALRSPAAARSAPAAKGSETPARWHLDDQGEKSPRRSGGSRWPTWVGGIATVAAAGGAVALGLSTNRRYQELRDSCGDRATPPGKCPDGDINDISNRGRIVNILWAVAGVSAVLTGVALYVGSREASVSVALKF